MGTVKILKLYCKKCNRDFSGIENSKDEVQCPICKTNYKIQEALFTNKTHRNNNNINSSKKNTNLKSCPYCGEDILAVAQKCKHCGEFLNHNNNMSNVNGTSPSFTKPSKDDKLETYWYAIIWCSLIIPLGTSLIVILSSVLYYAWKKEFPKKAAKINRQGWLAFLVSIVLWGYWIYSIFGAANRGY